MNAPLARGWRWRPGNYLRASAGLFGWLLVRAAAQVAMVMWLSRTLGATDYGRFVAVVAVASFLTPFAGLGLSGVLLRDGARAPHALAAHLSQALRVWATSAAVCVLLGLGAAVALLPRALPWIAVAVVAVGEIVSASLVDLLARAEQARHRVAVFGAINAGLALSRLLAVGAYVLLAVPTVGGSMWAYACGGLAYAALLWWWHHRHRAASEARQAPPLALREGLPFALGTFSMRLQAEFNKPVLAHLGFQYAGNFGVAQRAADIASLPLMALQEALWPRLYAGIGSTARMYRTGAWLILLAILGGCVLWIAAPWLPLLLGADFDSAAIVLRWLAWLPAVQLLRNLVNFHSISLGRTFAMGWAYAAGALASVLLTGLLVNRHGLGGAAAAAYLTEVLVIGTQIAYNFRASRQHS